MPGLLFGPGLFLIRTQQSKKNDNMGLTLKYCHNSAACGVSHLFGILVFFCIGIYFINEQKKECYRFLESSAYHLA